MSADDLGILLGLVALVLVLLPPKYDPMIGWKETLAEWPMTDNVWRRWFGRKK